MAKLLERDVWVPACPLPQALRPAGSRRSRQGRRLCVAATAAASAALLGGRSAARADLLSYYDFNSGGFGGSTFASNTPATFPMTPTLGTGSLNFSLPSNFNTSTYFAGTGLNNVSSGGTADTAGSALAIVSNASNGAFLDFSLNTSGHNAPVLTYETQRSASGATSQAFSYSTDGGATFTAFTAVTSIATAFSLQTVDFSSVTGLANDATVDIRMTFTGATTTTGNNRLDDVQFNAGLVGAASGILTYDPTATAGGTASTAFTTAATVMNFIDSGTAKDVAFANGNTVNFTQAGITAGTANVVVDPTNGVSPGNVNVTNASGTYNFSGGSIGGAGTLTKSGAGTLVLGTSNTFSGGTTINGGLVQVSADANLGTGTLTVNGGTLQTTGSFTSAKAVTLGANGGTFDTGANAVAFTGALSGSGTTPVTKVGTGTLTLEPFNTSIGTLNVSGGTLTFDTTRGFSFVNLGVAATTNPITGTLNLGTAVGNVVELEPVATTIVAGPGTINIAPGSAVVQFASGTSTISAPVTLGSNATGTAVLGGSVGLTRVLTLSGNISDGTGGAGGITFGGTTATGNLPGKVILTGANTYTGGTTIGNGTVVANNSGGSLGIGTVTVTTFNGSGGTLAGAGRVNAPVTVASGGTITAGSGSTVNDSTGTLNTGAQTWAAGGAYAAKANGGTANTADELVMSGLTISAAAGTPFTVTLQNVSGGSQVITAGKQFVLALDTNTGQAGVFANAIGTALTLANPAPFTVSDGSALTLAEVDYSGGEQLVLNAGTVAAPEPTSLFLLAAAAGPLVLGRRRRYAPLA